MRKSSGLSQDLACSFVKRATRCTVPVKGMEWQRNDVAIHDDYDMDCFTAVRLSAQAGEDGYDNMEVIADTTVTMINL